MAVRKQLYEIVFIQFSPSVVLNSPSGMARYCSAGFPGTAIALVGQ
jgi:hypothetical protein